MMDVYPKCVVKSASSKNSSSSSIKLSRWLLLSIGVYPPQTSIVKKILMTIQIIIFASAVASVMMPCSLYILFDDDHIKIRLSAGVSLISRYITAVAYWMIITRKKDIYNCIQQMETDWKFIQTSDERNIMIQYAKIGIFLIKISSMFIHCGTILFVLVRMTKTITFTIGNETFTALPMTCPVFKKIIDARFSPINEIYWGLQILSSIVSNFIIVAALSIGAIFTMHVCGQCKILYTRLNKIAQNNGENNLAEEKVAIIVKHHLRIFSFAEIIENIFSQFFSVIVIGSTLDLCLLGYYSITTWASFDMTKMFTNIFVYTSIFYNIFVYCYIGEMLTEECKNIGEIAYMANWYKLPHTTARSFVLIILRSNLTVKLTAGKIIQLSIATFGDIIKTSVAYMNFLRTTTL